MKLIYVAVMALSLGGCAVTNTKENPDICQQSADTIRRKFNRTTGVDKEVINVETSEKIEFYEPTPLKVFSSIESANLNNFNLTLKITDKGLFEQYSAPVVKPTIKAQYEAHPLTGTFTPIGIFVWLFNPTMMNAFTFGCTETTFLSPEPDKTRKVKTGKSEWKAIQKSHRISVSGFDKDYEFDVDAYTSPKAIDLSSAISNTELTKNTTLRVTCLDCDLLGPQEQNLFKDSKTNIILTHDFRPIKETMAESRKVRIAKGNLTTSRQKELNMGCRDNTDCKQRELDMSCRNDTDCEYGFSCRTIRNGKTTGGTECRANDIHPTEQAKAVEQSTQATPSPVAQTSEQPILSKSAIEEVKYTKSGGVYLIPVLINDVLQMKFIIDSGASDVSISPDVVLTLIKTETIKKRDWLPGKQYQLADGSIVQSDRFNIRTLKIGNRILKNVACSISNSIDAPMLLGQSALEQLGNFTFHYETGTVRFNK